MALQFSSGSLYIALSCNLQKSHTTCFAGKIVIFEVGSRKVFVPGIGQSCKRPAQRARLGVHGLADNGCAFGSVICRLPAGAARRCNAPRPRPDRFSCLASAASCCFLFIDSSERVWGSRCHSAPQRPRLDPRHGYLALTVACLRCFRAAVHLQSLCA